jgi:spore germination protein GerM
MRVSLVLVLAALTLVGCGIPLDAGPEAIEVDMDQPSDVGGDTASGELAAVSMYLIRNDVLVRVSRDLPSPASVSIILESLLDGVTQPEERANLRTAIPPRTDIVEVIETDAVLRVNLSNEFAAVGGEEEVLAVAQIVLTAVSIEGVDRVTFELDGVPTDVPVAGGALSDSPVGASDYESLVAP